MLKTPQVNTLMEILSILLMASFISLAYFAMKSARQGYKIVSLNSQLIDKETAIRQDANKRSRSVIRGHVSEHLAPLVMEDAVIGDFRFIGNPIDYLYIKGTGQVNDQESDTIEEIILLDIKSGASQLNKTQRRIRDAVVAGRTSFAVYNPDTKEYRTWKIKDTQI